MSAWQAAIGKYMHVCLGNQVAIQHFLKKLKVKLKVTFCRLGEQSICDIGVRTRESKWAWPS